MKNKLNRILSLVMALVMLVCALPMTAAAAEADFEIDQYGVLVQYNRKVPGGAVVIPDGVTEIGEMAFKNQWRVTSMVIPDGVTKIGRDAFYGCSRLTSVTIPNGVTYIGNSAFANCTSLTNVVIPNSVTSIGRDAFVNCTSLTSVVIPNGITKIYRETFKGCTGLTSVTIPDSVTEIDSEAFKGCTSLNEVSIPDYTKTFTSTFDANTTVTRRALSNQPKPEPEFLTAPIAAPYEIMYLPEAEVETKPEPTVQVFNDVAPDSPYYEAINTLGASGLLLGDGNGNFNPDNPITYGEFAVLLCRIYGIPIEEHYEHYSPNWGCSCDGTFSWACAAIQTAGKFRPTVDGSGARYGGFGRLTMWHCFDANELMNRGETICKVMGMWSAQHPEIINGLDFEAKYNPNGDALYTVERFEYQKQVDWTSMGLGVCTISQTGLRIVGVADYDFNDMPTVGATSLANHNWDAGAIAHAYRLGIVHSDENGYFNPKDNITRGELCQWLYNVGVTEPHCIKQFVA